MRTLDRLIEFDDRSRNFRAVEGLEEMPPKSHLWRCDVWNDQGQEGACVGFGWGHELSAYPGPYKVDNAFSFALYNRAKQLDQWEGEAYDGTSVLAGAKAVMEIKNLAGAPVIGEYRWAFGLEDIVMTLGWLGPVVMGTEWWSNMWDTDAYGFVQPTGQVVGGHCYLLRGVRLKFTDPANPTWDSIDKDLSFVRGRNSWGFGWGLDGDFKITLNNLDALVRSNGEACIPVVRRK